MFRLCLTWLLSVLVLCQGKPNILLLLTDDQDVELHGLYPMTQLQKLVTEAGASFRYAYTSSPLCCPSRASLLSGKYAHNHWTHNNSKSGGCSSEHWATYVEPDALPVLLQEAGYETFFAGKYHNQYRGEFVPQGWTDFNGLHGNSVYYNFTMHENGQDVYYEQQYMTDLLREKAMQFLQTRSVDTPFFAMIATTAPHAPYTPADRHKSEFLNVKALKTPSFNVRPNGLDKHWLLSAFEPLPAETLKLMDLYFQRRWQTLLAVDELLGELIELLEAQGELANTYVVFTSDNGYHMGQFAQPFDKRQPYETDIRVPLLVRGPEVPAGAVVDAPVLLLDLLPTMLEWAQVPMLSTADGQSFQAYLANALDYAALQDVNFKRTLLVQHWGEGNLQTYQALCNWSRQDRLAECMPQAACHCQDAWNNTYACLRLFDYASNRLYCEFQDDENFVEAYDIDDDPFQMQNLGYDLLPIERALYSLQLANLSRCAGENCRQS